MQFLFNIVYFTAIKYSFVFIKELICFLTKCFSMAFIDLSAGNQQKLVSHYKGILSR